MQKLHEWYYLACVYGWNFIEAKISGDIFNTSSFDLNDVLVKLHRSSPNAQHHYDDCLVHVSVINIFSF
jgi:hypothetical protein